MTGPLIEVIGQLDAVDDSDRYDPACIYAEGGPNAAAASRAVVCAGNDEGTLVCPQDPSLRYVLMVALAKEAIEVWSSWRGGKAPDPREKVEAVMYYSRHDAYLPVKGIGS